MDDLDVDVLDDDDDVLLRAGVLAGGAGSDRNRRNAMNARNARSVSRGDGSRGGSGRDLGRRGDGNCRELRREGNGRGRDWRGVDREVGDTRLGVAGSSSPARSATGRIDTWGVCREREVFGNGDGSFGRQVVEGRLVMIVARSVHGNGDGRANREGGGQS